MSQAFAGHHGAQVRGLQDLLLIIGMDAALHRAQKAGAHLDALQAPSIKAAAAPLPIRNAAGGNDRQVRGVAHLRDKDHCGQLAHMAAAFPALGNQGRWRPVGSSSFAMATEGDNRNDLDPGVLPAPPYIWTDCPRPVVTTSTRSFSRHLRHLVGEGTEQHNVDANGAVGQRSGRIGSAPGHSSPGALPAAMMPRPPPFRYGGGQVSVSDPGHPALKYRILDPQADSQISDWIMSHP